ncbi:ArsR/SmtB family transcription factor [Pararhizobium sp. LjRoot238]|uniref:ArsR/SmtB family transcription factor n=1 Tax=Pararhizobium sp. LjRoot238 TaxID=3342293 RepID=UPI003ECF9F33
MKSDRISGHCVAAAGFLSAAANAKRIQILQNLVEREFSVNELADRIGLSQSALSQHLSKLRKKHLIEGRREAQTIYYSSSAPSVKKLLATLEEICLKPESGSTKAQGNSLEPNTN